MNILKSYLEIVMVLLTKIMMFENSKKSIKTMNFHSLYGVYYFIYIFLQKFTGKY